MNFSVGENIRAQFFDKGKLAYEKEGTIIKIIQPFQKLTELEMKVYAELKPSDRLYRSVGSDKCKVVRLVLETASAGYTIIPVNLNRWKFTKGIHHMCKEELNKFKELKKFNFHQLEHNSAYVISGPGDIDMETFSKLADRLNSVFLVGLQNTSIQKMDKLTLKTLALQSIEKGDDIVDFPDGQLILTWQHKESNEKL